MAIIFPNDMRKSSNHVGISAFVLINLIFILIVKNSHASSGSSYGCSSDKQKTLKRKDYVAYQETEWKKYVITHWHVDGGAFVLGYVWYWIYKVRSTKVAY